MTRSLSEEPGGVRSIYPQHPLLERCVPAADRLPAFFCVYFFTGAYRDARRSTGSWFTAPGHHRIVQTLPGTFFPGTSLAYWRITVSTKHYKHFRLLAIVYDHDRGRQGA